MLRSWTINIFINSITFFFVNKNSRVINKFDENSIYVWNEQCWVMYVGLSRVGSFNIMSVYIDHWDKTQIKMRMNNDLKTILNNICVNVKLTTNVVYQKVLHRVSRPCGSLSRNKSSNMKALHNICVDGTPDAAPLITKLMLFIDRKNYNHFWQNIWWIYQQIYSILVLWRRSMNRCIEWWTKLFIRQWLWMMKQLENIF